LQTEVKQPTTCEWDWKKVPVRIENQYHPSNTVTLFNGGCMDFLGEIPDEEAMLVVTSPPYNLGKEYEKVLKIDQYLAQQKKVIEECVRILHPRGSICWEVGNYVNNGEIIPLDILLYGIFHDLDLHLRNRIIWHFEHGLHCSKRLSGRYEVILWFTKSDDYKFNLDPIRIPQKYPGKKYFKGPKAGQYSCNPNGKNPGDLWVIPNVKHNHVEKTVHPCQYPVGLIERLVRSMTEEGDLVFDPFMGVGTTAVAAILNNRVSAGAEIMGDYYDIAVDRIKKASTGELRTRPMDKEVYRPPKKSKLAINPFMES